MRGESVKAISESTGIAASVIEAYKAKARREARLVFPTDKRKAKPCGGKGKKRARMPLPAPPWWWENPNNPLWETPYLLPGHSANPAGTLAALGPNDRLSFAVMTAAANKRGITLNRYIARRIEIVDRVVRRGQSVNAAAKAVGEAGHYASAMLNHVGQGVMDRLQRSMRQELLGDHVLAGGGDAQTAADADGASLARMARSAGLRE
jgi:transposase